MIAPPSRAPGAIHTVRYAFIANVAVLFVITEALARFRPQHTAGVPAIVVFALIAAAAAFGGSLYLGRIGTGDATARLRYWVPFVIVAIGFFGAFSIVLAVLFIAFAHARLDSPAVRAYFSDPRPLPWLAWLMRAS
ncbi:MAG TPA: hypothetical protein VIG51_06265 [Candidatus Baltobacteraceae bacterium]|jgi:hypothetical protein